jgi:hypothetical protein
MAEREAMEFDVAIVGPAQPGSPPPFGLAQAMSDASVCVRA